jgi:hypothetical protein
MSNKINPVQQIVKEAIDKGVALQAQEIRALRARSEQASTIFKSVFWVGIVIFNLALWVPLPFQINQSALYVIAFMALVIGLVVPIFGLRKHQVSLELLKVTKETPKKKTASEAGRVYVDQVKKQGRPFVNAEFEALEGSKWVGKVGDVSAHD